MVYSNFPPHIHLFKCIWKEDLVLHLIPVLETLVGDQAKTTGLDGRGGKVKWLLNSVGFVDFLGFTLLSIPSFPQSLYPSTILCSTLLPCFRSNPQIRECSQNSALLPDSRSASLLVNRKVWKSEWSGMLTFVPGCKPWTVFNLWSLVVVPHLLTSNPPSVHPVLYQEADSCGMPHLHSIAK